MVLSARESALRALVSVLEEGAKPKDALEGFMRGLSERDGALARELVYGVLRRRDTLDWALGGFLRNPAGVKGRTLNNIRLGAYQMLYTRVPQWAAVNETVALEGAGRKALANAVLRNLGRALDSVRADIEGLCLKGADETLDREKRVEALGICHSHPLWMVRRWAERLGFDGAAALLEANNTMPQLVLRVNTLVMSRQEALERLGAGEPTPFSPVGIRAATTDAAAVLEALGPGAMVQDEAAQIVSLMLDPKPGMRVLDACSAPGGKAAHMAELMENSGTIDALDIDAARLDRLRQNMSRMGHEGVVRAVQADIADYRASEPYDAIMLDAPCSATGVIRRNPDVRYRLKKTDIKRLAQRQLSMLLSAAELLRPGGRMIYATCSTEPEEGEQVVSGLLKQREDFFIIENRDFGPLTQGGVLRAMPHEHGTDGFFAALLGRRPAP